MCYYNRILTDHDLFLDATLSKLDYTDTIFAVVFKNHKSEIERYSLHCG